MKHFLIFCLMLVVLAGVCFSGDPFSSSWGKVASITPTVTLYTNLELGVVSVYNNGSNLVYVGVNMTPTALSNAVNTASNAIAVRASSTFTVDYQGRGIVHKLALGSFAAVTNEVYIAGY